MRRLILLVIIIPLFCNAKSGLWFSFKTGYPLAGSSVGLKLGPLAPYGGIDIFHFGFNLQSDYTSWDSGWFYNDNTHQWELSELYKDHERESSLEGSATLFAPHAGARFYLKQNPLKLYLKADLMLLLPSIDGINKGERTWYNPDGTIDYHERWSDKISKADRKNIQDALDFIIFTPGVGVEYPFSEHFALGGEFGMRLIFNSAEYADDDEYYDEYDDLVYWKEKWSATIATTIGITYTAITLNYIF